MECRDLGRISFQQRLSIRQELAERWPVLDKFVCSAGEVEAAVISVSKKMEGQLVDVSKGTAEEALDLYNKVVIDGRYIDTVVNSPREVAEKLGTKVSDKALSHIEAVSTALRPGGAAVANVAVVAIAVAVTVVIVKGSNHLEQVVIDQSGIVKL